MNCKLGSIVSVCITLLGLCGLLFGISGSIVKAEQPATPNGVTVVNIVDDDGQITEHQKINSPIDASLKHQANIGNDSFGYSTVKYQSITIITSDAPDPSNPGETIVVRVYIWGLHGQPTGTVTFTTAPGGPGCSFYYPTSNHCSLTILLPGSYVITANYSGNSTYLPSSDTESHTVVAFILEPPAQSGDRIPGADIDYELQLTNFSSQADSYNLTLGVHSWDTALSDSHIGPVAPGASERFTVTVTIPPDANWYDTDSVVVTASSVAYPTQTDTSQVTTRAYAPPQISVSPESLSSVQYPDEIATQTLIIHNGYGVPLTFNIAKLIDAGLVAYYPFDGNANDYSGNHNDGIVLGAELTTGVCGIPDTAYEFDGLSHYIQVPQTSSLDMTGNLSLSAWVYVYNYPETFYSAVIDKDYNYTGYNLHIGSEGQLHTRVDNNYVEGGYISINQWHHVAVTYDGQLIKAYIDGVKIGETSEPLPTGIALKDLFIGSWQGERVLDGRIDNVRIYQRALSEAEIISITNDICKPKVDPWLRLNPTFGTVPTDESLPIQINFDASGLQPDVYTTTLAIHNNDPDDPLIEVPVTMTVVISGTPREITISGAESGIPGDPYIFTASLEPISTILPVEYAWQASRQIPITHTGGLTDTVSFTWDLPGTQVITVTASNDLGSVMDTHTIAINVPISGLVASNDSPTLLGTPTTFTATVEAGSNISYAWDFGDDSSGEGSMVIHTYAAAGVYTSTVTASNSVGSVQASTLVNIIITDVPLSGLVASSDSPTLLGMPTTFSATVEAGSNVAYDWDFGDNTNGNGAVVAHTYPSIGVFTATITATNSISVLTDTTTVTITDMPISGLLASNDSPTLLGTPTTFTATVEAGTNVTYSWDFSDETAGEGGTVSHTYAAAGVYTATVTASNSAGSLQTSTVVQVVVPETRVYMPVVIQGGSPGTEAIYWRRQEPI